MIALVDCNNFFASCEQLRNPKFQNKPLIVVSGENGIIIALSKEAKIIGLKRGMPIFQQLDLIKRHQVIQQKADHRYYAEISQKVMNTLTGIVDEIKVYSIDEAFLFLKNTPSNLLHNFAQYIYQTVLQETGIQVSIGVAPSKTLAKIASKYAKTHKGYHGVCLMTTEEQRKKALKEFPIEDVWGIGQQSVRKLKNNGINTAEDFCSRSQTWIKYIMHSMGETVWRELKGEDCAVLPHRSQKASISTTRTFTQMTNEQIKLEETISNFTVSCARKLRKQYSVAQELTVFLQTNRFRLDLPQIHDSITLHLPIATSDSMELIQYARKAVQKIYRPNILYKRAGIILSRIQDGTAVQGDLFDTRNRSKQNRLMKVLDKLQQKYGQNSVYIMSQGSKDKATIIDLSILKS